MRSLHSASRLAKLLEVASRFLLHTYAGFAYIEGNRRGPSIQDCERACAWTRVPSENLKSRKATVPILLRITGPTVSL
jgi:hypothetical protein